MAAEDLARFVSLDFEGFRALARDPGLIPHEKIGFPDSYRQGKELAIWNDVRGKLPVLDDLERVVVDVGPGCGPLAHVVIDHCRARRHTLVLFDSPEMLAMLPDAPFIQKVPGYYPRDTREAIAQLAGRVDAFLTYSVFHYVFREYSIFDFVDASLSTLARGGAMLIGDVPNVSQRKRFFSSPAGVAFHRAFTATETEPDVTFNNVEPGNLDDAVLLAVMARARASGFDAYVVPQASDLPMANRREDILIRRP